MQLATVVQERNFWELPEFTRRCIEEFGADSVRIRPFFPYFGSTAGEYKSTPEYQWFCDVRNPYHPYYNEYKKIMKDPIFKNPKVLEWLGNLDSQIGTVHEYCGYVKKGAEETQSCVQPINCECELNEQERKIEELRNRIDNEITDLNKRFSDIQNSKSCKIGRAATYFPRKIRDSGRK